MVIYYGNSIEEILKKNLSKGGNEPIIGVGVDVVVKTFNYDKPFFYKSAIMYLHKSHLDNFVGKEDTDNGNEFNRYVVGVKASVNMAIDKFKEGADSNKLVQVLENNWYTKKLINVDTIQEVQGFVFDPRERKIS